MERKDPPPPDPSPPPEDDPNETRGKLRIQGVGGSLSVLLQLAILAFGVRHLRNILAKRRQNAAKKTGPGSSPSFATITATALRQLISLAPCPYQLLDVRTREEAKSSPVGFQDVVNIPENELRGALQLPSAAWEHRFGNAKQPDRRKLLFFFSFDIHKQEHAAATAASLGYSRCCVLNGGLKALAKEGQLSPFKWINRDALAVLLSRHAVAMAAGDTSSSPSSSLPSSAPILLDLRRHDERAFFGSIPGSRHVPVDQLPLALESDESVWQKYFRQSKISKGSFIIMQSCTNKRAQWAAQIAHDLGFKKCFVYRQGVFGWRLHPSVLPYASYEELDGPPEPVSFELEKFDRNGGERELQQMGLF